MCIGQGLPPDTFAPTPHQHPLAPKLDSTNHKIDGRIKSSKDTVWVYILVINSLMKKNYFSAILFDEIGPTALFVQLEVPYVDKIPMYFKAPNGSCKGNPESK